jgi:hypothetical protein
MSNWRNHEPFFILQQHLASVVTQIHEKAKKTIFRTLFTIVKQYPKVGEMGRTCRQTPKNEETTSPNSFVVS